MLGNPGESPEQIRAGVLELAKLVPNSQISTTTPFPGTDLFEEGVKRGWIHNFDPDDGLVYGRGSWAPNGTPIDPLELRRLWLWAHHTINNIRRPGGLLDYGREMTEIRQRLRS